VNFEDRAPVGGVDYPRPYQEFRSWFPDDAGVCRLLGGFTAGQRVFGCPVCAGDRAWQDIDAALEMRGVWSQDLGDGRNDLPSHPHAAEHVVCPQSGW